MSPGVGFGALFEPFKSVFREIYFHCFSKKMGCSYFLGLILCFLPLCISFLFSVPRMVFQLFLQQISFWLLCLLHLLFRYYIFFIYSIFICWWPPPPLVFFFSSSRAYVFGNHICGKVLTSRICKDLLQLNNNSFRGPLPRGSPPPCI